MSELQNENHNEPDKQVKLVQMTCPHCETSPLQIQISGIQFDTPNAIQQGSIFWCGSCGKIFNVQITGEQKLVVPATAGHGLVGGSF